MRIRLQYSILTLLLLTTACAAVIAYVVVPWRYEVRQQEIISRLKAHDEYRNELYFDSEINSYTFHHWSNETESLQYFVDNMEDCDRISRIEFESECFNDQQFAKLQQLQRLDRLDLKNCAINETRMKILRGLSLKELRFDLLDSISFSTWPIQPRLEALILRFSPDHEAPPLKLISHARLRVLDIDSCPKNITIDSCRELTDLSLSPPAEETSTTIHLKNLPRLEILSLSFDANVTNFQLEEFPALQRLSINAELFRYFQNHKLQNLKEFSCGSLKTSELLKILQLPQLEKLTLRANWLEYVKTDLRIPPLPRLQDLHLVEGSSREGKVFVPEELAIRFVRQSPALQSLKLPLADVSDELLKEISKLPELRYVSLDVQGNIGDVSVLKHCKKLYQLELSFHDLSPERIAEFNKLTQIELLTLHHRGDTDIDMSALQSRPKFAARYNYNFHKTNYPIMVPDRNAKVPAFRCNAGMIGNVAPATATPTVNP